MSNSQAKLDRKAAKKAARLQEAQRIAEDPAKAILGKGEETEPTLEEQVNSLPETEEPAPEATPEVIEQATEPPEAPPETPETPEAAPEAKPATSLEDMVSALSPELREAALEQIGKLRAQAEKNEANKRYAQFDTRMKDAEAGIDAFIKGIAKETGVDLSGRKLTVSYPNGKVEYTNSAIGKKGEATGREGFPTSWGEAEEIGKNGKVIQKQSSPSKLANKMGLQVEGMRDMQDVFQNPRQLGSKAELPKNFKVEAVRGEYFRVIHLK